MPNDLPQWLSQWNQILAAGDSVKPPAGRPAPERIHPVLEKLEDRCLLSAVAPHHAAAAQVLGSGYTGKLQFAKHHGQPASGGSATLTLGSELANHTVAGTLVGPRVGTVAVTGRVHGHTLTLSFSGDATGTASLRIENEGKDLVGTLHDKSAGNTAKINLTESATPAAPPGAVRPPRRGTDRRVRPAIPPVGQPVVQPATLLPAGPPPVPRAVP